MKVLKEFDTQKELNEAVRAIEKHGLRTETVKGLLELRVHVGDLIRARDIILDLADEKKKLAAWKGN